MTPTPETYEEWLRHLRATNNPASLRATNLLADLRASEQARQRAVAEAERLIRILDKAVPNAGYRTRFLSLLASLAQTKESDVCQICGSDHSAQFCPCPKEKP